MADLNQNLVVSLNLRFLNFYLDDYARFKQKFACSAQKTLCNVSLVSFLFRVFFASTRRQSLASFQ